MLYSFFSTARVACVALMSTLITVGVTVPSPVHAHEVVPAIADMTQSDAALDFVVTLNLEALIAGIDMSAITDTNDAPEAASYDELRAMEAEALSAEFTADWSLIAAKIAVTADGTPLTLTLHGVEVPEVGDIEVIRPSVVRFSAALPEGAGAVTVGWAPAYGTLVLRQQGVEAPYTGFLEAGAVSDPISLSGGGQLGQWATFLAYIPVGFDHIVPLGLDHILFVLGLFFLSTRLRPLLWQVSAFTLAHTITLALAGLGWVSVPGSIVEPLIALSIVYVAFENIFTDGLSRWRPFIIFGFGLLHGLGFASVLAEFGLPENAFVPALIGFNVGVEFGQLAVIAVAFICVYKAIEMGRTGLSSRTTAAAYLLAMIAVMALAIPLASVEEELRASLLPLLGIVGVLLGFSAVAAVQGRVGSYREVVSMPASVLIALAATYWVIERVFL